MLTERSAKGMRVHLDRDIFKRGEGACGWRSIRGMTVDGDNKAQDERTVDGDRVHDGTRVN